MKIFYKKRENRQNCENVEKFTTKNCGERERVLGFKKIFAKVGENRAKIGQDFAKFEKMENCANLKNREKNSEKLTKLAKLAKLSKLSNEKNPREKSQKFAKNQNSRRKFKFAKLNFAKISAASLIIFAISFACWLNFANQNQNRANAGNSQNFSLAAAQISANDISNFGEITDFLIQRGGANLTENSVVPLVSQMSANAMLKFTLKNTENLAAGAKIEIPILRTSNSTYRFTITSLKPTLEDFANVAQFDAEYVQNGTLGSTITLTKNATATAGDLTFTLDISGVLQMAQPLSESEIIAGNISVKFKNSGREENITNMLGISCAQGRANNAVSIGCYQIITRIYNDLLNGIDISAKYADLLSQNYIQVITIEPNVEISDVNLAYLNGRIYDLMSDGKNLNNNYATAPSFQNNFTKINLAAADATPVSDEDFAEIYAEIPTAGTYGIVKNADGGYTIAFNWGKLLGGDFAKYNNNSIVPTTFPNSEENRVKNQELLNEAMQMVLAPEAFRPVISVNFYDESAPDSLKFSVRGSSTFAPSSGTVADDPKTNQVAGQTAVKIHFVDEKKSPISAVKISYNWPAETALAAPAQIAGYTLLTLATDLDNFATAQNIPRENVLANSQNVVFPAESENSAQNSRDVYFVYKINKYLVNFVNNCASFENCSENSATQTVNFADSAQKPKNPTRENYHFLGWFSDAKLTKEFDFNSQIVENTTIYARWEIDNFEVDFVDETGENLAEIPAQNVNFGDSAQNPAENNEIPARDGEIFVGWFADENYENEFDFATRITKNTKIYAKFEKVCPWNAEISDKNESCAKLPENENENAQNNSANSQNFANSNNNSAQILAPNTGILQNNFADFAAIFVKIN